MPNYLEKGGPMPAHLGRCADLLSDVRALRLSMQKQVDEIEAREREIKAYIINSLSVDNPGAVGMHHMVRIVPKDKPSIVDWGVFCSWVRKNDRFDCLQKRLSDDAVMTTMAEEKRRLPGLDVITVKDISLTKV